LWHPFVGQASAPVVTYWEGEVVDNVNHKFLTGKWGACADVDLEHWMRFPGFTSLLADVGVHGWTGLVNW
jgi:hypothetical protein